MDDDPDALWKPGYRGGYRTPERGSARAPEPAPRRPVVALVALGLVLVAVTAAILTGVPRSEREPAPAAPVVPGPWTVTFDTTRLGAVTVTPELVVAVVDRPGSVVALDRADGAERWRRSAPGASATGLDVVDGAVLVRHVEADGRGSVVAFDATSGVPLWERPLAVGETIEVFGDVVVRGDPSDRGPIDPRRGDDTQRSDAVGTGVRTGVGPSDHVVRGLSPDERLTIEAEGAVVTVLLDGTTATVTLGHEPLAPVRTG